MINHNKESKFEKVDEDFILERIKNELKKNNVDFINKIQLFLKDSQKNIEFPIFDTIKEKKIV